MSDPLNLNQSIVIDGNNVESRKSKYATAEEFREMDMASYWRQLMAQQDLRYFHRTQSPDQLINPSLHNVLEDRSRHDAKPSSSQPQFPSLFNQQPSSSQALDISYYHFNSSSPSLPQTRGWDQPIPLDSNVESGKLANGLHYFIQGNCTPVNRVILKLVVKVGSSNETMHQKGFAHIVEHLVFRQTATFPDNEIQRFLSRLGARPGADSNASTLYDYTVFNLMIPVDERTVDHGFSHLQTGIKVLSELASKAVFSLPVLEQEKRIVIEECRLNSKDFNRNTSIAKAALCDTPYFDKSPIGDVETILKCNLDDICQFYRNHYRHDNMAVIAVGGFVDTKILVKLISQYFSPNSNSSNASNSNTQSTSTSNSTNISTEMRVRLKTSSIRTLKMVDPVVSTASTQTKPKRLKQHRSHQTSSTNPSPDSLSQSSPSSHSSKHAPMKVVFHESNQKSQSNIVIMFRSIEPKLNGTMRELKYQLSMQVLSWLINHRANLMVSAYLGRLLDLAASESRLTSTIRVFEIGVSCAPGCELEMLKRVWMEIERLKRFDLATDDLIHLRSIAFEMRQRSREIGQSGSSSEIQADKLVKYYLFNEPVMTVEEEFQIMKEIIDSWISTDFQRVAQDIFDSAGLVLFASLPSDEIQPGTTISMDASSQLDVSDSGLNRTPLPKLIPSDFEEVIESVSTMDLDSIYYFDTPKILDPQLLPPPGTVMTNVSKPNSRTLILDNGSRIQIHQMSAMDCRNSLGVEMELSAEGGTAEFWTFGGLQDMHSAMVADSFAKHISIGGITLGLFQFELGVILEEFSTLLFERKAKFACLPNRVESLFQIIYCLFTRHPTIWSDESCQQEITLMLEHTSASKPFDVKLRERAIALGWQSNALIRPLRESDLMNISLAKCRQYFERCWSNPAEFCIDIYGDFSTEALDQLTDLITKYIGSIPARNEPIYDVARRTERLIAAHNRVARSIRFKPGITQETYYDAPEGSALVLLVFPIPSLKTVLDSQVTEVIAYTLETYLFLLLRSHLARVYSVSVSHAHHFGPYFPGELSIQFICDPPKMAALSAKVIEAISDLQEHGPPYPVLESCRAIYRKKLESIPFSKQQNDGINLVFGTKVSTRDLDSLLDNSKLAKSLFKLLLPLDNYVQVTSQPESHKPVVSSKSFFIAAVPVALIGMATAGIAAAYIWGPKLMPWNLHR